MSSIYRRHWPGNQQRPALALHCMLASGSYWGPVAKYLDGQIDLHGFDMPGHGQSSAWEPGPDDPDYHTAVTRIAAGFIDRPVDLIGHSMGATVALRIAIAAPDALRSLTLIEPVLFAAAPAADKVPSGPELDGLLAEGRDAEATRGFLSVWGAQSYDKLPPDMQTKMRSQIRLVSACSPTLMEDDADILREGGLESVGVPALLISGENSPGVIHDITDALAARLPDVGRAKIPGAGHMSPVSHPEQVAGLIGVNLGRG